MALTAILAVSAIILASIFYTYRKWNYGIFKRLGIPGPDPEMFIGNFKQAADQGLGKTLFKWYNDYGPTFGYFEGPTPVLATTDLEIIRSVYISNFSNFPNRKMVPQMNEAVDIFLEVIESKAKQNKPFDMVSLFSEYSLDVIASCAFGLKMEAQRSQQSRFRVESERCFANIFSQTNILVLAALIFPGLNNFLLRLRKPLELCGLYQDPQLWVEDMAMKIIESREHQQKTDRVDFIQLMLNAHAQIPTSFNSLSMSYDIDGDTEPNVTEKKLSAPCQQNTLTKKEVVATSTVFLLAGHETSSTSLANATYRLALNPEVQDKLFEEINLHIPENKPVELADLKQFSYLDMVISEVLRMHPLIPSIVARRCQSEVTVNGIRIPCGMNVTANVYALHYDADHWGPFDPEQFQPDRFLPMYQDQRDPLVYMPFGIGPRNCVGMRFAMIELKITLIRLLRNYRLLQCAETEVPLQTQERGTIVPKHGIYIRVVKR
ncbi:cytochrome P450 3A11-like isoform X2 [Tubulanus polymorphus]|uniref:cytochrome P450 3A11-like isoform X2 n=1 Tax=Tubulanus polymorphus TaxID=672921 RepID=UPI003DA6CD18